MRPRPVATTSSRWSSCPFILDTVFLLLVALYAFRASLGGQPLFRRGLLEE